MKLIRKKIKGLFEIKLKKKKDKRGYFMRACDNGLLTKKKLNNNWVHFNESFTKSVCSRIYFNDNICFDIIK